MKINKICLSLFLSLGYIATSSAETDTYFDPEFLELPNKESVDLEQFERNEQLPGQYYVDIYINKSLIGSKSVSFSTNKNNELEPCLTLSDLKDVGVKVGEYPELQVAGNQCINLSAIPDAKSEFEFGSQRLYLSIPQIALNMNPRGYVDLAAIDDGITALLLNYSYNGSRNTDRKNDKNSSNSNYVNLRPGLNIGPWRLRNYTTWQSSDGQRNKWDTVYTYLSRNINAIKSQLILGDSSSPSDIFDSVPFRGVQLSTDDDMNPESLRGYAPVVRGIARSNAQITIRQNGYTIYQTDVASLIITNSSPASTWNVSLLSIPASAIKINVLSCSLKNNKNTYDINMGDWYDTQFKNINDTQGTVAIPIALSCLAGTNIKVTVTSDTIDNAANGRLGLTGADKATGIAVQLLNNAGTPIVLNQKLTQQDNVSQGDYIFGWKARYIKTAATITPGTANANATVNIRYE